MKRAPQHIATTASNIFGRLVVAGVLILVAIWISSLFSASSSLQQASSVEVQFADASASGLAIVPASCPSDPHIVGECSPVCPNGLDRATYPTCSCPVGQTPVGGVCQDCLAGGVDASGQKCTDSCPNGLDITDHPQCKCPAGQVQSGTKCVDICPTGGTTCNTCPNGLNEVAYPSCQCPAGKTQVGSVCTSGSCVSNAGSVCTSSGANICNMRGTGTVQCNGTCSAVVPSNDMCNVPCWDGSARDSGGNCPACPVGYVLAGNSCVPPDGPIFESFPTSRGFTASGQLEVRPSLVRSGDVTYVFWKVKNVRDCTVRGSNGDGASGGAWDSTFSGSGGQVTSAITSRTTYTLFCHSLAGATPSTITQTKTVNVIPSWIES